MKASIIILNWNGPTDDCAEAVESALAQDYEDKEVIFVDNGSSNGSYEAIVERYPQISSYQTGANIGCPAGRNYGAARARGELLFFLENDGCYDGTQVVSDAVELFRQNSSLGAVYMRITGYHTDVAEAPLDVIKGSYSEAVLSSSFCGGAAIIRADIYRECGGYPDDFFRQAEERYLSFLIWNKGFKVAFWPKAAMRHKGSDYQGKRRIVFTEHLKNDMRIVARLYPLSLGLPVLFTKMTINVIRLVRAKMFSDINLILKEIAAEFRKPRKPVALKTVLYVEALRRGFLGTKPLAGA